MLAAASLLVLVQTALAFPPHPDYALPFVPAFVLLALAALAGRSSRSGDRPGAGPRGAAGVSTDATGRQRRNAHGFGARQSSPAVAARIGEACAVVAVLAIFVGYRRAYPERALARGAPVPPDADGLDGAGVP